MGLYLQLYGGRVAAVAHGGQVQVAGQLLAVTGSGVHLTLASYDSSRRRYTEPTGRHVVMG